MEVQGGGTSGRYASGIHRTTLRQNCVIEATRTRRFGRALLTGQALGRRLFLPVRPRPKKKALAGVGAFQKGNRTRSYGGLDRILQICDLRERKRIVAEFLRHDVAVAQRTRARSQARRKRLQITGAPPQRAQHNTSSDRTPLARMLARSRGSMGRSDRSTDMPPAEPGSGAVACTEPRNFDLPLDPQHFFSRVHDGRL